MQSADLQVSNDQIEQTKTHITALIDGVASHPSSKATVDTSQVDIYLQQLRQVKLRATVFRAFSSGQLNAIYPEPTLEVGTVQLRAMTDLLAACLAIAAGEAALPAYYEFVKFQNADLFFGKLARIDANFYPRAITERSEGDQIVWDDLPADTALSASEFPALIAFCNRGLRPPSPGAESFEIAEWKRGNAAWFAKLVRLMDVHLYEPTEGETAYLFQMRGDGDEPRCYQFGLVGGKPRSQGDIENRTASTDVHHLKRQLDYLRRSCELYDLGHQDEAVRMASVMRTLFHDTTRSVSLLRRVGVADAVKLKTSFGGVTRLPPGFEAKLILPILGSSADGGTSAPFPLQEDAPELSIRDWWNEVVWKEAVEHTRRQIVLDTAHEEGGAHVELKESGRVRRMRRGLVAVTSMKVNGVEVGVPPNQHFVLIRQFAHEVLNSDALLQLEETLRK